MSINLSLTLITQSNRYTTTLYMGKLAGRTVLSVGLYQNSVKTGLHKGCSANAGILGSSLQQAENHKLLGLEALPAAVAAVNADSDMTNVWQFQKILWVGLL